MCCRGAACPWDTTWSTAILTTSSQKWHGAKGQPWGELGACVYCSASVPCHQSMGSGGGNHKDVWKRKCSLKMSPLRSLRCSRICLKPVIKFSVPRFPLLLLIWFQQKALMVEIVSYSALVRSEHTAQAHQLYVREVRPLASAPVRLQQDQTFLGSPVEELSWKHRPEHEGWRWGPVAEGLPHLWYSPRGSR